LAVGSRGVWEITVQIYIKIGHNCDDMALFQDHLAFLNSGNFNGQCGPESWVASMCHKSQKLIKRLYRYFHSSRWWPEVSDALHCRISWKLVKQLWRYCDFSSFQDGDRPQFWICFPRCWTTHDAYLVVITATQNLVGIHAVVSMIWTFEYFARFIWKRLFTPQSDGTTNPQNRPFPSAHVDPRIIHSSLDRPHSPSKTASGSSQPFCHSTLSGQTNRPTHTQTDRWDRWQVSKKSAYARSIVESDTLIIQVGYKILVQNRWNLVEVNIQWNDIITGT